MQSAALPKARRLIEGRDYRLVFSCRQRIAGQFLVLNSAPNDGSFARLGLAVGKRNCRRAVDRNRVKRVIREWFRLRVNALPASDMVYSVRPRASQATNTELRADLEWMLSNWLPGH